MIRGNVISCLSKNPSQFRDIAGWVATQGEGFIAEVLMQAPSCIKQEGAAQLIRKLTGPYWAPILALHPELVRYMDPRKLSDIEPVCRRHLLKKYPITLAPAFAEADAIAVEEGKTH